MNKKKQLFLSVCLVVVLIVAIQFQSPSHKEAEAISQASTQAEASESTNNSTHLAANSNKTSDDQNRVPTLDSQQSVDIQSLHAMTKILHKFANPSVSAKDLIQHLEESGQKPTKATQSNPYTGDMTVVRTDSPLPGTRYFHAQYFSDGGGRNERIQHMAFEFRPSPEAMKQVVQSIKESFSDLGEPTHENDKFIGWKLNEEYVIWVNKLEEADLKDHPFNAYTPRDAGTIRVAIQEEIHDEDHAH